VTGSDQQQGAIQAIGGVRKNRGEGFLWNVLAQSKEGLTNRHARCDDARFQRSRPDAVAEYILEAVAPPEKFTSGPLPKSNGHRDTYLLRQPGQRNGEPAASLMK